jgi:hypothetical protein
MYHFSTPLRANKRPIAFPPAASPRRTIAVRSAEVSDESAMTATSFQHVENITGGAVVIGGGGQRDH